jgi:hypothetical protein
MCGITGIFDTRGKRDIDRAVLHRMNESQFHRGPDEGGLHVEPGVGLGHRRCPSSISRPASSRSTMKTRRVCVVFNGEIYNYQELIPELQALGHAFHTRSDTEVIVHAWESWGENCVDRFRGMFAFALWDRNRETLFLARDRLGVKPLHYALLDDGTFLFGSELKSLLAHGGLKRDIDPCAVEEYFALGYVAEPRAIFKQARKLPPAHTLLLRRGQPVGEPREYWDVRFTLDNPISDADACAELTHRLEESIRLRMISEVPLGAFLSGGVDSSAVVAIMAGLSNARSTPARSAFPTRHSTNPNSPRWSPTATGPITISTWSKATISTSSTPGQALRRTLRRQFGHPHLPCLPAGAQARHRGAFRRWGRRKFRRLPPLQAAPDGRKDALGPAAERCAAQFSALSASSIPRPTGRPASSGPRPPSKAWPAPRWRPISLRFNPAIAPMRDQLFSPGNSSPALGGYDAIEVFNRSTLPKPIPMTPWH